MNIEEQIREIAKQVEELRRDYTSTLFELRTDCGIARRVCREYLEERENRWYRKLRRLCDSMIRRVHWHMPRR